MTEMGSRCLPVIYQPGTNPTTTQRNDGEIINERLEFRRWEYRFWALEDFGNDITCAVCRYCENLETSKEKRRQHHTAHGCAEGLCSAYALLLREPRRCVVCDSHTTWQKFGVPLCYNYGGNGCLEKFYKTPTSDGLQAAIRLVELRKGMASTT